MPRRAFRMALALGRNTVWPAGTRSSEVSVPGGFIRAKLNETAFLNTEASALIHHVDDLFVFHVPIVGKMDAKFPAARCYAPQCAGKLGEGACLFLKEQNCLAVV